VEANDYYPFGLAFNSYQAANSASNRWKFQGQEHVDDLGLNWDSFKWRNHQPDIGRFFNLDPLAEKYVFNSPYAFSENKIVTHVEFEGLESVDIKFTHFKDVWGTQKFRTAPRADGGQVSIKINLGDKKVDVTGNKFISDVKFTMNEKGGETMVRGSYNYTLITSQGETKPSPATFRISITPDFQNEKMDINTNVSTIGFAQQIQTTTEGDYGGEFLTGAAPLTECTCYLGFGRILHWGKPENTVVNSNVTFKTDLRDNGKSLNLDKISLDGKTYRNMDENNAYFERIPVIRKED
jgi:RHS repeat-associated protein